MTLIALFVQIFNFFIFMIVALSVALIVALSVALIDDVAAADVEDYIDYADSENYPDSDADDHLGKTRPVSQSVPVLYEVAPPPTWS